jgi:hypothetical protein
MPATELPKSLNLALDALASSPMPPELDDLRTFHALLCTSADEMRRIGLPLERAIAGIKRLATERGIRDSHDRLITEAVLWCIDQYCFDQASIARLPTRSELRIAVG